MHFGENSISKDIYFAVFRLLSFAIDLLPKTTIQRINNCFNLCLYKLLNFKKSVDDNIETFNENLSNYGLFSFQHRIMFKLFNFSHSYLKSRARSASRILISSLKHALK
jgi:hypothetical protein